jgi:SAM-dependent methyltransferase
VIKLNLGCGDKILDGYVNVDVVNERAGKSPDVVRDIKKLDKFDSNYADEVMAIHVVEHFDRLDIVDILREWSRVLKPGGKMILECPNLESDCKEFLKDPINHSKPNQNGQRTMWVFYGDPSWRDPLMMHKWGYTPRSLAQVMHEAGLMDLKQEPAQYKLREPRDMRVTGLKPGP